MHATTAAPPPPDSTFEPTPCNCVRSVQSLHTEAATTVRCNKSATGGRRVTETKDCLSLQLQRMSLRAGTVQRVAQWHRRTTTGESAAHQRPNNNVDCCSVGPPRTETTSAPDETAMCDRMCIYMCFTGRAKLPRIGGQLKTTLSRMTKHNNRTAVHSTRNEILQQVLQNIFKAVQIVLTSANRQEHATQPLQAPCHPTPPVDTSATPKTPAQQTDGSC